ncbi:MAG: leucyl aminopeptidase [Desulfobacterales bacterium]|nr:leucyl aminopeptidase [Desulfobacterales bacterium]
MIKASQRRPETFSGDLLVYFVRRPAENNIPVCGNPVLDPVIDRAYRSGDFTAKAGQTLLVYPQQGVKANRLLVVGLGREPLDRELFRLAGGTAAAAGQKTRATKMMAVLPGRLDFDPAEMAECLTEGLLLGAYQFRKYMTVEPEDEAPGRIESILLSSATGAATARGIKRGAAAAAAGCAARDMANEPGNVWTPASFAEFGEMLARDGSLVCTVLGKNEMKKMGMGGILGVNSGSARPPALVIVEYRVSKKAPTLLLVGKGLTFDSGGISIKPSAKMEEMKYDMCGGAAVLAAMQAVAAEKPGKVNVVAVVPATENLPGPAALKPGDIITVYNGKTVEVVNTDAEGRLILADALAYAIEKFKPAAVIDIATLTGAVVIGLGHHRTGMLANDDDLAARVADAAGRSGEPVWRLPLGPEYRKQIKSEVADIKNVGNRAGGTITAAVFLQEFVNDIPWVHLDIAGTAWNFTEKSYIPKGPSGIGARTFIELIRNWK